MASQEIVKASNGAADEDAERSAKEHIRDLINAGIIDEKGRVFSENLRLVEELLRKKGFGKVSAFHRGNVPGGAVRLHEKVADGRNAEGPYDAIRALIKKARSHDGLWRSLEATGYCLLPGAMDKKKTG